MTKPRRDKASFPLGDTLFAIKQRKAVRHEFVLDVIAPLSPETRSMFGCLAVYDASSFEIGSKSARPRKRVVDVSIRSLRAKPEKIIVDFMRPVRSGGRYPAC
jgi:hypothetical protein